MGTRLLRQGQAEKHQRFPAVRESSGIRSKGKRAARRPPFANTRMLVFYVAPTPRGAGTSLDVEAALLQLLRMCGPLGVVLIHHLAVEEMH